MRVKILCRQLRQRVPVDLVLAERLLVTLKTYAMQPRRYVHVVTLGSEEWELHLCEDIALPSRLPAAALK
jgi:hypothetical protein